MSCSIKKEVDYDHTDYAYFQEMEDNTLKDETKNSPHYLVKTELSPPDEVIFEDSVKEKTFSQEEMGDSASKNGSVTKPEIVWFIKSEAINKEETMEEENDAFSREEYNGLLFSPKSEPLLTSCKQESSTHDSSTLHSGKMKVRQDDDKIKASKEIPDLNFNEKEETSDNFIKGQCGQNINVKKLSKLSAIVLAERIYKCDFCYKNFGHKGNLQKHLRIHTGEKPHECSNCLKKFTQKGDLQAHLRIHTGEKPFECRQCNKKFREKGGLQRHLKIHTGEKSHECSICQKKFAHKGDLQNHLTVHTGEKPFECIHCNKMFREKRGLHKHLKIHRGEKPHECSNCHKKFTQKGDLHIHLRIHTGEKPFECSQCNKMFRVKGQLQKHLMIHSHRNRGMD